MRCPVCGKCYANNKIVCENCQERLITEKEFKEYYEYSKRKQVYKPKYRFNTPKPTPQPQPQSQNIPKCPICGSTDLQKITLTKKAGKIALFGIFGMGDNGKTWKCKNCGSKF